MPVGSGADAVARVRRESVRYRLKGHLTVTAAANTEQAHSLCAKLCYYPTLLMGSLSKEPRPKQGLRESWKS